MGWESHIVMSITHSFPQLKHKYFLPGFLVTTNVLNTVKPLLNEVEVVVCGSETEQQTGPQDAELMTLTSFTQ